MCCSHRVLVSERGIAFHDMLVMSHCIILLNMHMRFSYFVLACKLELCNLYIFKHVFKLPLHHVVIFDQLEYEF